MEVVAAGTLGLEAGNVEPAGVTVVAGTAVAGNSEPEDLLAGAGGAELGGVGQVTDDGDASVGTSRGGAEGAGGRALGNGAGGGAEESRHVELFAMDCTQKRGSECLGWTNSRLLDWNG